MFFMEFFIFPEYINSKHEELRIPADRRELFANDGVSVFG